MRSLSGSSTTSPASTAIGRMISASNATYWPTECASRYSRSLEDQPARMTSRSAAISSGVGKCMPLPRRPNVDCPFAPAAFIRADVEADVKPDELRTEGIVTPRGRAGMEKQVLAAVVWFEKPEAFVVAYR